MKSTTSLNTIAGVLRGMQTEIIVPEGYEYICNVGEVYYKFDPKQYNNIMAGEVVKVYPPDDIIDFEMVEICWSVLEEEKGRAQYHEKSESVVNECHTDVNIVKVQYYIYKCELERIAIKRAIRDIKSHENAIETLDKEVDIDFLKKNYAEYFI